MRAMTRLASLLRRTLLAAWLVACASGAAALEPPGATPVLSIAGAIDQRNGADTADFDLAMLEKMPQHVIVTKVPWHPQPRKYTGVLLRELLAAVGAHGRTLHAIALNDYRVDIPVDDVNSHDVIVAYRIDDRHVTVREKGPLLIMYPFDSTPQLRDPVHFGRAAWQLRRIEVR